MDNDKTPIESFYVKPKTDINTYMSKFMVQQEIFSRLCYFVSFPSDELFKVIRFEYETKFQINLYGTVVFCLPYS